MRRDDELIRAIMMEIERLKIGDELSTQEIAARLGRGQLEVYEHERMLRDVRWIETLDASAPPTFEHLHGRMTMAGHDFLAAVRSETVWKKALARAAPLGGVPLEVLKALAIDAVKETIGLGTSG